MQGMDYAQFGELLARIAERNSDMLRYVEPSYDLRKNEIWLVKLSHGADTIILSTVPRTNPGFKSLYEWLSAFVAGTWQPDDEYISRHNAKIYTQQVVEMLAGYRAKINTDTKAQDLIQSILTDLEKRQV